MVLQSTSNGERELHSWWGIEEGGSRAAWFLVQCHGPFWAAIQCEMLMKRIAYMGSGASRWCIVWVKVVKEECGSLQVRFQLEFQGVSYQTQ